MCAPASRPASARPSRSSRDAAEKKDCRGDRGEEPDNLMCRASRLLKREYPQLGWSGDVALDPYTDPRP
jgi:delta-aminolevulinic acid dehydratase/porphobilinogen synthase